MKKLDKNIKRRKEIAEFYRINLVSSGVGLPKADSGAVYLRYNILSEDALALYNKARDKGILLGNWYREVIDPKGVDYNKIGYNINSCPKAELYARFSVNLPTYPRLTNEDLTKIVSLFNKNGNKRNHR